MKFHNKLDAQRFLAEIGKLNEALSVSDTYQATDEELKSFISLRSPLVRKIKNHRQSSVQKANWRTNRFKIMRGIKSFHKSVAGKRFHRKLGRLLATRITRDKTSDSSVYDKHEALEGINSLKQHLIVELGYFHILYEQIEIEELLLDHAIPILSDIEKKILGDEDLTDDEQAFIMDMIERDVLLDEISKTTGESFENLKKWCEDITTELESNGITQDSPEYVTELLKVLIHSSNETKNGI